MSYTPPDKFDPILEAYLEKEARNVEDFERDLHEPIVALRAKLSAAEAKVDALMRQLHAFYDVCSECGGNGYGPDRAYGSEVHQDKCDACNGEGRTSKVDALMREKEEQEKDVSEVIEAISEATGSALLAGEKYPSSDRQVIYRQLCEANNILRALVREQQNTTQEDKPNMEDMGVVREQQNEARNPSEL